MPDNAIKAEVFATLKVNKKTPEIIPMPRTALLQEAENNVNIPTVNIDVSESAINCAEPIKPGIQFVLISDNIEKNGTSVLAPLYAADNSNIPNNARKDDVIIDLPVVASENKCKNSETTVAHSVKVQKNQLGSLAVHVKENEDNIAVIGGIASSIKEGTEFISKPRMALFKEGEDDEPMPPHITTVDAGSKPRMALFQGSENDEPMTIQNIHAENFVIGSNMATCMSYVSPIQFGAFICDGKYRKKDDLFTATGLLSKIYFGDATLFKRKDNMPSRR